MSYIKPNKYTKLLFSSLLITLLALALSIPLHCTRSALIWGSLSALDGFAFGLSMAIVTRTKKIPLIYLGLLFTALTLRFLILITDVDLSDIAVVPHGWYSLWSIYLDPLRWLMFCVCIVYPFARFGWHDADSIEALLEETEEI